MALNAQEIMKLPERFQRVDQVGLLLHGGDQGLSGAQRGLLKSGTVNRLVLL
jgi:hypothetical protein